MASFRTETGLPASRQMKGEAQHRVESFEAAESVLGLLPSIAVSFAQSASFYCGGIMRQAGTIVNTG